MNTYTISNFQRPECGAVTIQGVNERSAVLRLLSITGSSRGICDSKEVQPGRWYVMIQNGWTLIVQKEQA